MKKSNPTHEDIVELAKKLFYEMKPIDGHTWENTSYHMVARPLYNEAAIMLGWTPEGELDER